jgi:glycosyltransferase involved in cell wall biosynthesis
MIMKTTVYNGDNGGCFNYRVRLPVEAMQAAGHDIRYTADMIPAEIIAGYDVMVNQLLWQELCFKNAYYAKAHGARIVYELDDYVMEIDPYSPAYEHYSRQEVQQGIANYLMLADAVTVTTKHLANKVLAHIDTISNTRPAMFVLPNCVSGHEWEKWQTARAAIDRRPDIVTIGWHGSATHIKDLAVIVPALLQLMQACPNVRLVACGLDYFRIFKAFERFADRIEYRDWKDPKEFAGNLIDFDIGLAPLENTRFNKCKSNVKFLEYSMLGIPCIASNVEPYECIQNDKTGLLVGANESDWLKALIRMVRHKSTREGIGQTAKNWVMQNRLIENNYHKWAEAYTITAAMPQRAMPKVDFIEAADVTES